MSGCAGGISFFSATAPKASALSALLRPMWRHLPIHSSLTLETSMRALNIPLPLICALVATLPAHAQDKVVPLDQALARLEAAQATEFIGRPDARVRDAAQFDRMKAYLRDHYAGVVARHFFELEPGSVVDCVDELTQPGAQRLGLTRATWVRAPSQAPRDAEIEAAGDGSGAIDRHGRDPGVFLKPAHAPGVERDAGGRVKSCAKGTIPKIRLDLDRLAAFESLEHFRHKLGQPGTTSANNSTETTAATAAATVHDHAKAYQFVTNWGAESYLNVWKAYTEKASEFSLLQIWVTDSDIDETVEAGWQVYRNRHLSDYPNDPHLFIYSTQDGYNTTGCYDLDCSDFVQTNNVVVIGGRWTNQSVVGGSQYSTPILIHKDGTTGNWWIKVDGVLAGYYPRTLYDSSGMRDQADRVSFGGEIVNTWPSGRHTKTDMGSGYKPSAGFGYAAYQRTIRYVDTSNTYTKPTLIEWRANAGCYDIDSFYASGDWKTYFYIGGEGYDSSICP
jgi:Neprosin